VQSAAALSSSHLSTRCYEAVVGDDVGAAALPQHL